MRATKPQGLKKNAVVVHSSAEFSHFGMNQVQFHSRKKYRRKSERKRAGMNDSQPHRNINDSLAKQQWACEKLNAGPIFGGELSILKKRTCRVDTSSRRSHFKKILDQEFGWVFHSWSRSASQGRNSGEAISQLERLKSSRPSAPLLLWDVA